MRFCSLFRIPQFLRDCILLLADHLWAMKLYEGPDLQEHENVSYLSDPVRKIGDYPDLALVFGLHPLRLPQVENFSAFLADTDNGILQEVRNALVSKLIQSGEIKGTYLAFDSTNIPVKVKENNLKTSVRDRFKKNRRPKGDPESRLGVMIHELISDSALDSAKVLSFIIYDLKDKVYISRNLRREKTFRSLKAVTVSGWLWDDLLGQISGREKDQNQVCLLDYPFQEVP